jgi:signal transduction histidine kinase
MSIPVRLPPALAAAGGTVVAGSLIVGTWPAAPYRVEVWLPLQTAGLAFLFCGTLLWLRRPGNGTGRLMTLLGTVWYFGDLQLVPHPWAYAIGFCFFYANTAVAGHLVLALPDGRLGRRYERRLVAVLYAAPVLTQIARFITEYPPQPQGWGDPRGAYSVWAAVGSVTMLALAIAVVVLLLRRWTAAGRAVRREYAPVWCILVGVAVAIGLANLVAIRHPGAQMAQNLALAYAYGMIVVPFALAAGLLRVSLARLRVAELIVRLQAATAPEQLRTAVAVALGDPELDILYRAPDGTGYRDASGRVAEPRSGPGRHITAVGGSDHPAALLIHDAGLTRHRALVDAVVAAARLALDNARLLTHQRALLDEVSVSRARIVLATDVERRRIQRDLHDGVQHDLLALSMLVRRAQDRLVNGESPDGELGLAARRLPELVHSVRSLAEGIHPPILAEQGLAAALETIAERAMLPVILDVPTDRWPAQVERAAYYVITEALSNAHKHAAATHARIRVAESGGRLSVTVVDDGSGGADPGAGSGLDGLRDRAAALGGTLDVSSAAGAGTTITAELPCVS